jgi:pimeloyl-ACP methyl ester carboxylesterase
VHPKTEYARSGALHIAYQVVGSGPLDLVYVPGWVSHVDLAWEEPMLARFLTRLASFSRLITFDKRGTGLSDRVPQEELPTLEARMDDLRAVMDAAGSERAAIFGFSEGGNLSTTFAATYPERTSALIMFGTFAKRIRSPDYPWAPTVEERQQSYEEIAREWAHGMTLDRYVPSMLGDEAFTRRLSAYFRSAASPGAAVALLRMNSEIDVRQVLPAIHVPTLVMHRTGDRSVHVEEGRWMAGQIPGARFVELTGEDHMPWVGDQDAILDEIQEFLTGIRPEREPDRVLATVLVTDIVGSTRHATRLGDRAWSELLTRHHEIVRGELRAFRGREVDTAGDGFLATFDGPARAVGCACRIRDALRALGLEIRAGLHTGEIELAGGKPHGIAVHTGARIASVAQANEILVSSTVKDLVSGSGIRFADRGMHALKDIPRQWQLFAVGTVS